MKHNYSKVIYATAAVVLAFMIIFLQSRNSGSGTAYVYPGDANPPVKKTSTKIKSAILNLGDSPGNSVLHELNNELVDIASRINPSVVTVFVAQKVEIQRSPFDFGPFSFFDVPGRQEVQKGMGSGVIVSKDGYILTNNHVVKKADNIKVRLYNGKQLPAKVIGTDPKTDIAVIKINAKNLPVAELGNSDDVKVGQVVMAVGSPLSKTLVNTVTMGIISAKGRANEDLADYSDYLQTDAAINPGNSGGPLVNVDGKVIGINSAIATQTGGFQGIGFAIPINMAKNIMEQLIKNGKVVRGFLGVNIQPLTPAMAKGFGVENARGGAVIAHVEDGTPADKAGLKTGDVIVALNGHKITDFNEFRGDIASTKPGTVVTLTIFRDGKKKDVKVKLGEMSGEEASNGSSSTKSLLNFTVHDITQQLARRYHLDNDAEGVVVTSIDKMSAAYDAGLREGDVITSVDRQRIQDVSDFDKTLKGVKKGDTILLRIVRGSNMFFLAFQI